MSLPQRRKGRVIRALMDDLTHVKESILPLSYMRRVKTNIVK